MASIAITGKPGGGKSYLSVLKILNEIENGSRPIVTNVPLNLDAIVLYFSNKGKDIDVYSRITVLPHGDFENFWRYRGNGFIALDITPKEFSDGIRPDWSKYPDGGVLYVLDEVHEYLNSRQWASTGPVLLFYIMKHRHLGDDIFWITQAVMNVDKQWRSATQEYIYCRNWAKESFRGFVKGTGFGAFTYLEPFTGAQQVQSEEKYKLDLSVASCYCTSIAGKAADTAFKLSGLNVKWLYIGLFAAMVAVALFFIFGVRLFSDFFSKPIPKPNIPVLSVSKPTLTATAIPTPTPTPMPTVPVPLLPIPYFARVAWSAEEDPQAVLDLIRNAGDYCNYDSISRMIFIKSMELDNIAKEVAIVKDYLSQLSKLPTNVEYKQFLGYSLQGKSCFVMLDDDISRRSCGYHIGVHTKHGIVVECTPSQIVMKNSDGKLYVYNNRD